MLRKENSLNNLIIKIFFLKREVVYAHINLIKNK